jgi:hypothetical protein
MRNLLFLLFLSLSACASNPKYAPTQVQSDWSEITCSGFKTWHDCRQQARASCPNGFYMADSVENLLIQRRVVSIACKA